MKKVGARSDIQNAPEGKETVAMAACLDLGGVPCKIVCVDGVAPLRRTDGATARPRHMFCDGELAHFSVGGHQYSLLATPPDNPTRDFDGVSHRDLRSVLTNRELQIVQLICMGLLTKQVADRLKLSEFTVRSYLKTVYAKLGVRSRGGMVYAYARMFGTSHAAVATASTSPTQAAIPEANDANRQP
jgi:DNA-binding CsgD family transcriptional regulator